MSAVSYLTPVRYKSKLWFLLPIMMGITGGLIAFFVIRNANPEKAKDCLYLGAALTALAVAAPFMLLLVLRSLSGSGLD